MYNHTNTAFHDKLICTRTIDEFQYTCRTSYQLVSRLIINKLVIIMTGNRYSSIIVS